MFLRETGGATPTKIFIKKKTLKVTGVAHVDSVSELWALTLPPIVTKPTTSTFLLLCSI